MKSRLVIIVAAAAVYFSSSVAATAGNLRKVETPYYTIYSDLDEETIREASLRITRMAEEYHARTKAFAGVIRDRLPFYLFRHKEDYMAAGGLKGSAGVFMFDKLMAIAGNDDSNRTWEIMQHEGFHQFAHAVIRGDIPVWVNEGMAEYFEQALFTGDAYVSGIIPSHRLKRIKSQLTHGTFLPMQEMMLIAQKDWNQAMKAAYYDQAWSMVHFLAHAENGRYEKPFNGFLRDVGRGLPWDRAWIANFGPGVEDFEKQWRSYWLNLEDDPTADRYSEAIVRIMTNYLARATCQQQRFDSFDAFREAAVADDLKAHPDDWLPDSLLDAALPNLDRAGTWTLKQRRGRVPSIVCTRSNGVVLTGTFKKNKDRVKSIRVVKRTSR